MHSAGSFQHIVVKTREENLDPRAEKSLTILSAAKSKDVNAIQWRAWSLPKEEEEKLPTMCWVGFRRVRVQFPLLFYYQPLLCQVCHLQFLLAELPLSSQSCCKVLAFVNWLWRFVWGHGSCQEHCTHSPQQEQNYKPVWFPQSLPIVCGWGG